MFFVRMAAKNVGVLAAFTMRETSIMPSCSDTEAPR